MHENSHLPKQRRETKTCSTLARIFAGRYGNLALLQVTALLLHMCFVWLQHYIRRQVVEES